MEKIIEEILQKIEEAEKSEGFFITITCKKGEKLEHYQAQNKFNLNDIIPSLEKIKRMITEEYFGLEKYKTGKRTFA